MNTAIASFTSKAIQPPDKPTNVAGEAIDSQVSLIWKAPTNNGGLPITSYTVSTSPDSSTATTTSTSTLFTGMSNGTSYTFNVVANNALRNSSSSISPSLTPYSWTNSAVVTVVAGGTTSGTTAGTGTNAKFNGPRGLTLASDGNIYLGCGTSFPIFKITIPEAVVTFVTKSTSTGNSDGTGTNASVSNPRGFCSDNSGNVYFADWGNHLIRKLVVSTNQVITLTGSGATSGTGADGVGTNGKTWRPFGICIDKLNNILYIAGNNGTKILKLDLNTSTLTTIAGQYTAGNTNGVGTSAQFTSIVGLAVDNLGNLYCCDNTTSVIRKIVLSTMTVTTFIGQLNVAGSTNGTGTNATLTNSTGITFAPDGNLYVCDGNNLIRKITLDGVVTTHAGKTTAGTGDGTGTNASFNGPFGICFDTSGNMYITEAGTHRVRKIT